PQRIRRSRKIELPRHVVSCTTWPSWRSRSFWAGVPPCQTTLIGLALRSRSTYVLAVASSLSCQLAPFGCTGGHPVLQPLRVHGPAAVSGAASEEVRAGS